MRKLLFAVIVAAAFVGCSQSPKTQVDINSVLVEHNKQVHKIFDYLRGRDDGSLLIDSIADKFNMKFEFANAEPQRTFKQFKNTVDYDDISINTFLNFDADTLNMIVYNVRTIGKDKYNTFVSLYNTVDSIYKNDSAYTYNELLDFWMTRKTDKYVCLFKPTADNDTVYISVPIMPLNEQLLKQMEETYKRDLANSNK